MSSTRVAIGTLFLSSALLLSSSAARAQAPAQLALFKTAAEDADLAELAAALDPVVLSELAELTAVQVSARPALDLPSIQLAIDCVGETLECLRAVAAQQAEADSLLAPSVSREGDAILVSLLYYQPGDSSPIRRVQRRYSGARPGEQALAGVEGMLAELFPPPPEPPPPAAEPLVAPAAAVQLPPQPTAASTPEQSSLPIAPVILGGVGVALLGTSLTLGLMSNASHANYDDTEVTDDDSAQAALDELHTAENQARAANVTLGLGLGALVAGGVWLIWQLTESGDEPGASVRPHVAKGELGLTLSATWSGEL